MNSWCMAQAKLCISFCVMMNILPMPTMPETENGIERWERGMVRDFVCEMIPNFPYTRRNDFETALNLFACFFVS